MSKEEPTATEMNAKFPVFANARWTQEQENYWPMREYGAVMMPSKLSQYAYNLQAADVKLYKWWKNPIKWFRQQKTIRAFNRMKKDLEEASFAKYHAQFSKERNEILKEYSDQVLGADQAGGMYAGQQDRRNGAAPLE